MRRCLTSARRIHIFAPQQQTRDIKWDEADNENGERNPGCSDSPNSNRSTTCEERNRTPQIDVNSIKIVSRKPTVGVHKYINARAIIYKYQPVNKNKSKWGPPHTTR